MMQTLWPCLKQCSSCPPAGLKAPAAADGCPDGHSGVGEAGGDARVAACHCMPALICYLCCGLQSGSSMMLGCSQFGQLAGQANAPTQAEGQAFPRRHMRMHKFAVCGWPPSPLTRPFGSVKRTTFTATALPSKRARNTVPRVPAAPEQPVCIKPLTNCWWISTQHGPLCCSSHGTACPAHLCRSLQGAQRPWPSPPLLPHSHPLVHAPLQAISGEVTVPAVAA